MNFSYACICNSTMGEGWVVLPVKRLGAAYISPDS